MKKLEIIIRPENLEKLKDILNRNHISGMNIANIMGCGNQKGLVNSDWNSVETLNLLPKIKVETVMLDEQAHPIIEEVVKEIQTGQFGDGKIFVSEVEDAVRIRTGVTGEEAL